MITKTIAAVAVAAGLIAVAPSANAAPDDGDHRHCVTNREANLAQHYIGRTELEARWEVTGLGERFSVEALPWDLVEYPWCGHPDDTLGVAYGGSTGRSLRVVVRVKD